MSQDIDKHAAAWHTEDHLSDKSATTYNSEVAERWRDKGWPVYALYNRIDAVNEQQDAIESHGNRMGCLGLMLGFLIGFAAAWLLAI